MNPAAGALLAETRRSPGRVLLTGLAITVAVVFAATSLTLGATMQEHLTATGVRTPAATDLVITPTGDADPAELLAQLRDVDGVGPVAEHWTAYPTLLGSGGGRTVEFRSDPTGGVLDRVPGPVDGTRELAGTDVLVGANTAARLEVTPGAALWLLDAGGGRHEVTAAGVAELPGEDRNTVLGTPDAVRELGGELEGVDVAAAPGTDPAVLAGRVRAALGDAAGVTTGAAERAAEAATASASVQATLVGVGIFVALSLVAAVVIVASAFRVALTQRRVRLALLRCIGAGRGQIVGAVLVEALVTGLVAGVVGIAAAVGIGRALLAGLSSGALAGRADGLISGTVTRGEVELPELVLPWPGLAAVLAIGVLATVAAAVGPALAASRVSPLAALGSAGAGESGSPRLGRRLALAGVLVLVAVGLAALALGGVSGQAGIVALAASGLVLFAALVAAGPLLTRAQGRLLAGPVSLVGRAAGRLAVANAADVPRRTAATVAVLAMGVGLTAALLVGLASTRASAEASVRELFPAELVVLTPDAERAAGVLARLADEPAVRARPDGLRVLADPAPGVAGELARRVVEDAAGPGAIVQYVQVARDELDETLSSATAIGLGMVGMTAAVALVGVGVTLTLSVTERLREIGLLRALGLTRHGVRSTVAWEAAMGGLAAAVLGAVIGAAYGQIGAEVLGIGAGLFPGSTAPSLVGLVVGVTLVSVLAAMLPAARAGRVPPIRALREG